MNLKKGLLSKISSKIFVSLIVLVFLGCFLGTKVLETTHRFQNESREKLREERLEKGNGQYERNSEHYFSFSPEGLERKREIEENSKSCYGTLVKSSIVTDVSQKDFFGTIEGSLSYPSKGIPPNLMVCALDVKKRIRYCSNKQIRGQRFTYGIGYSLNVPEGLYYLVLVGPEPAPAGNYSFSVYSEGAEEIMDNQIIIKETKLLPLQVTKDTTARDVNLGDDWNTVHEEPRDYLICEELVN